MRFSAFGRSACVVFLLLADLHLRFRQSGDYRKRFAAFGRSAEEEIFPPLGDLRMRFLQLGEGQKRFSAFGKSAYDIFCIWEIMFAGCCPTIHCKNGNDEELMNEMSSEELKGLRRVFDAFDANHDGFLALEELCLWMQKLGRPMTKPGLLKILKSCDWNNDGRLDFNEFVALTHTLDYDETLCHSGEESTNGPSPLNSFDGEEGEIDPKSEMKEAFRVFDKDGNGLISPTELKATLCELGLLSSPICLSRIHSMIKKVDRDGDGQISFPEFEIMMIGK